MEEDPYYRICPVCGKKFYIPQYYEWAYKRMINKKVTAICSWRCIRIIDTAIPAPKKSKFKKKVMEI